MTTNEWIAAIKDIVLASAAVTTAIVAVVGVSKWRKELEGKSKFEAARNLIKATYKLRDQLQICRSPFYSAQEFPDWYNGSLGKHGTEEETKAWIHIYKNRWESVGNAIQEFDSQILEAEALWGPTIRSKTNALRKCVRELNAAIDAIISDKASGGEDFRADKEFAKGIRSVATGSPDDEKNALNQRIAAAISGIEDEIRPHLRRA